MFIFPLVLNAFSSYVKIMSYFFSVRPKILYLRSMDSLFTSIVFFSK